MWSGFGHESVLDPVPEDPVAVLGSRKGWTMNRFMIGMALVFLLAGVDALSGQTSARVDIRKGGIGVGVAINGLPARVSPHGPTARGWVAADWGPVRIRVVSRRPSWLGRTLHKQELRHILGKETVKRIERHAKAMGIRGRTEGRWFPIEGRTMVLEVLVDRIPVAEVYDYRGDGYLDEIFLTGPLGRTVRGEWHRGRRGDRDYDRYGRWGDDWDDRRRGKRRYPW
jgi:hypothetical protein